MNEDEQEKNELLAYAFNKHADNVRAATVDECARVVESYKACSKLALAIAAALRALKDKPILPQP